MIAILAFLILNPMLRLVISSLQEADSGSLTLANYRAGLWQRPASAVAVELAGTRRRRRRACHSVRRPDRLGDFPHRYAGQGLRPADGVRRLCDAALSRRHRLDPAGRSEFRMAQQGLDGADRRRPRHLQYLLDDRPDPGHRGDVVSLHLRVHQFGARPGVVRNGRRREYSRRPHAAHHAAHHVAVGDAGDHRRRHHHLPRSHRVVRRARADRIACAFQRSLDPALAILQYPGPGRGGRGLRHAAARHHRADVLGAAPDFRRRATPP